MKIKKKYQLKNDLVLFINIRNVFCHNNKKNIVLTIEN